MKWILALAPVMLFAGWSTPVTVQEATNEQSDPKISANSSDEVLFTWNSDSIDIVQGSSYNPTTGEWSTAIDVSDSAFETANDNVAINTDGIGVAVWRTSASLGALPETAASTYTQGAWSVPEILSSAQENVNRVELSSSGSGNAFAVWSAGGNGTVRNAIYNFSTNTWSATTTVSAQGDDAREPSVSANSSNKAIIGYQDFTIGSSVVKTIIYNGSSWSSPAAISSVSRDSEDIFVAINESNVMAAAWVGTDGDNEFATVSINSSGSWSTPVELSTSSNVYQPRIVVDSSGNAYAFWGETDGSDGYLKSSIYTASSDSWSTATNISEETGASPTEFSPVVSSSDIVYIAWQNQGSGSPTYSVLASRYVGGAWESPTQLNTAGTEGFVPVLTAGANGKIFAGWGSLPNLQSSLLSMDSSIYTPSVSMPTGGRIITQKNQVVLLWNSVEEATSYNIYQGSTSNLIGSVSSDAQLRFVAPLYGYKSPAIYIIRAVDSGGVESSSVTLRTGGNK